MKLMSLYIRIAGQKHQEIKHDFTDLLFVISYLLLGLLAKYHVCSTRVEVMIGQGNNSGYIIL